MTKRLSGTRSGEVNVADLVAAHGKRLTPEVERGWQGHLYVVPPLPPDKPRRKRWLRAIKNDDLD